MSVYNDSELQEKWIRDRDADAFAELVARYSGIVYCACRRILRDPVEAEDVTQECFLSLSRRSEAVSPSLCGWLYVSTVRIALQRLRTMRRRRRREQDAIQIQGRSVEPAWDDISALVDEAIAALPDEYRRLLLAHFMERKTYDSIAADSGIPRSTAVNRINRALELVRESLRNRGALVPAVALGAWLGALSAEAMPSTLSISLAKLAIAGSGGSTISAAGVALGGILMAKKVVVGICAVVAILFLVWRYTNVDNENVGDTVSERPVEVQAKEETADVKQTADAKPAHAVSKNTAMPVAIPPQTRSATPSKDFLPGAALYGCVKDDTGQTVSGALVELEMTSDIVGTYPELTMKGVTNQDGEYSFTEIKTFSYPQIYASAPGYMKNRAVAPFRLMPGEERRGLNIVLQKGGSAVAGRVVTEEKSPISGAVVNLVRTGEDSSSDDGRITFEVTDTQGRFTINWREQANCDFIVTKEGYGPGYFKDIATGTTNAEFILKAGGSLEGKVTWTDGTPAAGAWVRVFGNHNVREGFWGAINPHIIHAAPITVYTDAAGRYSAGPLGDDFTYDVWARDPAAIDMTFPENSETYFAVFLLDMSERFRVPEGDGPWVQRDIHVTPGEVTKNIDLVLSSAAVIEGTVITAEDNLPAYPLLVCAAPTDAEDVLRDGVPVSTDESGKYKIFLELGESQSFTMHYQYIFFAGGWGPRVRVGSEMNIDPGQHRQFDFKVPGAVTVPVHFVDEKGADRPDIYAGFRKDPAGSGGQSGSLQAGEDGRVILRGILPGKDFQILGMEFRSNSSSSFVNYVVVGRSDVLVGRPGQVLDEITVVCVRHANLAGLLLDSAGHPVGDKRPICLTMQSESGELSEFQYVRTWADGRFLVEQALYPQTWARLFFLYKGVNGLELATADHVVATGGDTVDVGTISGVPIDPQQAQQWFDPNRIQNLLRN